MGERETMREPHYECYGGPLDGDTISRWGGAWWWTVPGGHYRLAALSDARGNDMGTHWLWRPGHPRPMADAKPGGDDV